METKFNFKSQVCTSIEQSCRLLELGLKKETADMVLLKEMVYDENNHCTRDGYNYLIRPIDYLEGEEHRGHITAWSLGRLWELLDKIKKYEGEDELSYPRISLVEEDVIIENPKSIWVRRNFCSPKGVYENIINCLEELITEGYFPKEYLE